MLAADQVRSTIVPTSVPRTGVQTLDFPRTADQHCQAR